MIACTALPGCGAQLSQLEQKAVAFEQRAAPVVAQACDRFHRIQNSTAATIAVTAGEIGVGVAFGAPAGNAAKLAVDAIEAYGERFCTDGPPAGDTTTAQQKADWLNGQISDAILRTVGVP